MSVIQERIVNNGHGGLSPSYFCVHSTANIGATAANHVSLWSRGYAYAVHLVSDWREAYHTVPYNRLCWQVGNGNRYVEGLEICEATNREDFERGVALAAQVVRERLAAHGWGIDRLICHAEASRMWGGSDHSDPLPYFSRWGYSWEQFKNLVVSNQSQGGDVSSQDLYDTKGSDGRNIFDSVIQTRSELKDRAVDALYQAKGNDGRNIFDGVIQARNEIAALSAQVSALSTTVAALTSALGANPESIAQSVEKAAKDKLESLKITVQ